MLSTSTAFAGKTATAQSAEGPSTTRITELAPSGAWCWFQDPRAVYHEGEHCRTYTGWITLAGDVHVASIDADTGEIVTHTVREKLDPDDHRYQYARWGGKRWNVHEITRSAGGFTLPLADGTRTSRRYAGGVTLNHSSPSTVYASAKRGGVFEIEKWTTPDLGETWTSQAVTSGSTKNNVRPVVPWGFDGRGVEVLWMHGDYYYWKGRYHTAIWMRTVNP